MDENPKSRTTWKGFIETNNNIRTENQIGMFVVGDFCQYWKLNFQISNDFDIQIMVSKARLKKKLIGQTRFT